MGHPRRQADATQIMKTSMPQQWANQINGHGQKAVESIIAMGRDLIAAKKQLGHGAWAQMFQAHPQAVAKPLQFSLATAERLMTNARHGILWQSLQICRIYPRTIPCSTSSRKRCPR